MSPKVKRDKMKAKIYAAFGPHYRWYPSNAASTSTEPSIATERGVPVEFKAAYPRGCLRNLNRVLGRTRPSFLGERLKAPTWWQHAEIMGAIDKSLVDQVSLSSGDTYISMSLICSSTNVQTFCSVSLGQDRQKLIYRRLLLASNTPSE